MENVQIWVTLCLFSLGLLHVSVCITVTFPKKEPLYVALGRTLVLEAEFQLQQTERIILRTWERKNSDGEVRIADADTVFNKRMSVENNGALLRIKGVEKSDYGLYKITVTSNKGDQVSDSRQVLEIKNPPEASLSMKCSILTQAAQWDRPSFVWKVNGVNVTNENGEISEDGSMLQLKELGQNYTCITDSSQGTSRVEVRTTDITQPRNNSVPECSCTVLIVLVVIESIILCFIIGWCIYKRRSERAEREQTL